MEIQTRADFEKQARRVEALVQEVQGLGDEDARASAVGAIQAVLDLHGLGLERILAQAGPELSSRLAADEAVAGLLLLHGLHPVALEDRVRGALDKVRPYLASHGGGVEVLGFDEGVVRLRLEGSCHGCASSTATLRDAIEKAILEAAPDAAALQVEGVAPPAPQSGFVPLGSIRPPERQSTWQAVEGLRGLGPSEVRVLEVGGAQVAFMAAGGERYAYRDRCPGCGSGLAAAALDGVVVT
ncbi:MAG: NifU family protein, partial [Candidatus Dormibacteraeota bacterium]|nr:NifU family protein [Candidatus Dormibacteraeota bacterium]